jgi:hypothetical protein
VASTTGNKGLTSGTADFGPRFIRPDLASAVLLVLRTPRKVMLSTI